LAVHRIRRGLDLPLSGAPAQVIEAAAGVPRVALVGADYHGLKPGLQVQVGTRVLRGSPLFEDKRAPGVRHVAPAAGTVAAIHRGEMRAFQSIVIDVDSDDGPARQVAFASHTGRPADELDPDAVRALLLEPEHDRDPRASVRSAFARIYTACDLRHHDRHASTAPAVDVALAGRKRIFAGSGDRCSAPRHDVRLRTVGSQSAPAGRTSASRVCGPASGRHARAHIHGSRSIDRPW
jgi:hypothetical protein